jgi:FkbM family methyltransferase
MLTFEQTFIERQYKVVPAGFQPRLIVDCGANIGCSAVYFLSRYPDAELIAVEADPDNFDVLCENVRPYGPRARAVHAAVWSEEVGLAFDERSYRDGLEWSRQVRPVRPDETPAVNGVGLDTFLAGTSGPSLLKLDIEGAEVVVISSPGIEAWLDRVDVIVAELHQDTAFGPARDEFIPAVKSRGFTVTESGELTLAWRPAAVGDNEGDAARS